MKATHPAPSAHPLYQPLDAELQEMISKPFSNEEDDDRHAPARRALLKHLRECGVDSIDLHYRCDPIVVHHERDLHVSLVVDSLRMRNGATIKGKHLQAMPACMAMERLKVIDSIFALQFGVKVENVAMGLYPDMDEEDGITQEPRAGLLRILTLRGDVMNMHIDEEQAQEIFDSMPDPHTKGLLEPGAVMHGRRASIPTS